MQRSVYSQAQYAPVSTTMLTQPVLVLQAKAKTAESLEWIKRTLEDALKGFPEVGPVRW